MNVYDAGETVHNEATFHNEDGTPTDPGTVELFIERPDGTVGEIDIDDIVNVAGENGLFRYDDTAEGPGITWARWKGTTGDLVAIRQSYYYTRQPRAVPAA